MLTCQFCGYIDDFESEVFEIDTYKSGFWCDFCDEYTYISENAIKHRFTLILEDKNSEKVKINSKIKLSKRLSPYRYPGGKIKK